MNAPWPVELSSVGPVRGAASAWQARGNLGLTFVAKATFRIDEATAVLLAEPDSIVVDDEHYEASPLRSVARASDLAPYKPLADVTLIGHAYAPDGVPTPAMNVRLGVFQGAVTMLDKSLCVVGDQPAGSAMPLPFDRLPLAYERAARSKENPVGTTARPNLRDPHATTALAGTGPLSRYWSVRRDPLSMADRATIETRVPTLEASFPWSYFQAAPPDQRIAYLRGDEWIVIDGVHPTRRRVASRLPGVRAAARVTLRGGAPSVTVVRLLLDTLAIDADRMIANLVFRTRVDLPEGVGLSAVAAEIGVELPDAPIRWSTSTASAAGTRTPTPVPTPFPTPVPPPNPSPLPAPVKPLETRTMALDFSQQSGQAPRAALPFRAKSEPPAMAMEMGPARTTPALPIVNASAMSVATLAWQVKPPQDTLTVIVKGTFDLVHGGRARAREESELVTGDLYTDDDDAKSLAYASDFAVLKRCVDVTCVGHAYPPGGSGTATQVELVIGTIHRKLAVFGDRRWETRLGVRIAPTSPAPFRSMPIVYERAFGGPTSDLNPVGLGRDGALLPNLEDPKRLIQSPSDAPAPACFAPISITWPERATKLGTYGGSYRATRWPYFAEDFDASYFQAAPVAQRLEQARGDESFKIVGMHPEVACVQGTLPGLRARCFVEARDGGFRELALALDTIAFDMNEGKVNLVWRGLLDVSQDEAPEVNALFVLAEPLDGALMTLEAARALYLARVTPPRRLEKDPQAPRPANDVANGSVSAAPELAEVPPLGDTMPEIPMPSPGAIESAMRAAGASDDEIKAVLRPEPVPAVDAKPRPAHDLGVRGEVIAALASGASLAGRDLSGADLSRLDFSGKSLAGATLSRADLSGVKAVGADFAGVIAERARFSEADLTGACFDGATLTGADFTRATLEDASLKRCKADDIRLYDARAARANFDESSLVGARAAGVTLDGATLRGVNAERSIWESASLENTVFAAAKLAGASFARVRGTGASFAAADIKEGRFRRAALPDTIFLRANLMMATFERACLDGADLRGANLHAAETWNASLEGAQLDLAILTRSKLAGAAR